MRDELSLKQPHFSTKVYASYLSYIRQYHPEVPVDSLIGGAGLEPNFVKSSSNWVSVIFDRRFTQGCIDATEDPAICYKVGLHSLTREGLGDVIYRLVRNALSVRQIYRSLDQLQASFSQVTRTEVLEDESGKLRFKFFPVTENLNQGEKKALLDNLNNIFLNTLGHYAAVPTLQDLPPAHVSYAKEEDEFGLPSYEVELEYQNGNPVLGFASSVAPILLSLGLILASWLLPLSQLTTVFLTTSLSFFWVAVWQYTRWRSRQDAKLSFQAIQKRDEDYARLYKIEHDQRALAQAAKRFVPWGFLDVLNIKRLQDIQLGDNAEKRLTYLFLDIRGFTSLSEQSTSNELFSLVNDFYEMTCPIVSKHQGEVVQYTGDGLLAVFHSSPLEALKACKGIFEGLETWNEQQESRGRRGLEISVGMSTGRSTVGVVGWNERYSIEPLSRVVNFAAKLEQMNRSLATNFLVDQTTAESLPTSGLKSRYVGQFELGGGELLHQVYEVFEFKAEHYKSGVQKGLPDFQSGLSLMDSDEHKKALQSFQSARMACLDDGAAEYWQNYLAELMQNPARKRTHAKINSQKQNL